MNHSRAIFFETWIFYFHVIALHRIHLISHMIFLHDYIFFTWFFHRVCFSRDCFTQDSSFHVFMWFVHMINLDSHGILSHDSFAFTWFSHMIHLLSFADCLNHLIHMWFSVHDSHIFWSPFTQFIRFLIAFSYINDSLKFTCDFNMHDSFIFTCFVIHTIHLTLNKCEDISFIHSFISRQSFISMLFLIIIIMNIWISSMSLWYIYDSVIFTGEPWFIYLNHFLAHIIPMMSREISGHDVLICTFTYDFHT